MIDCDLVLIENRVINMNILLKVLRLIYLVMKVFLYILLSIILYLMGSKSVLRWEMLGNRKTAKRNINRARDSLNKFF